MNSLTGVGYIHEASFDDSCPEPQRKQILEDYARISGRYQELIDATTMSTLAEMAPERLETLASIEGIQGIFANYGRTHVTTSENLLTIVDEKPVFRSVNAGPGDNTFTLEGRREAVAKTV